MAAARGRRVLPDLRRIVTREEPENDDRVGHCISRFSVLNEDAHVNRARAKRSGCREHGHAKRIRRFREPNDSPVGERRSRPSACDQARDGGDVQQTAPHRYDAPGKVPRICIG